MPSLLKPGIQRFINWLCVFTLLAGTLSGCVQNGSGADTPGSTNPTTSEATPSTTAATETVISATETPAPAAAFYWLGGASDSALEQTITDLGAKSSLVVTKMESLDAASLGNNARIVIAAPASDDETVRLNTLAQNNPSIPFILLGGNSTAGLVNLTVLPSPDEETAFIAAMIAAMVTDDWRIGYLNRVDLTGSQAVLSAFTNGAKSFCGACTSKYGPVLRYPVSADLAGMGDWQTGLTALKEQAVTTVFIDPTIDTPEIQAAIAAEGMLFITTKGNPTEAVKSLWVATLTTDLSGGLEAVWTAALNGQTIEKPAIPVSVSAYNADILTEARLRLVNETIQLIEDGQLVPGAVDLE